LPPREQWRSRVRTARAIVSLTLARALVAGVAFKRWRQTLGYRSTAEVTERDLAESRALAVRLESAAKHLFGTTKCLPRAMALSWALRQRKIGHVVVFAVRPSRLRGSGEDLHARVDVRGTTVLGDLAGDWGEVLRIPESTVHVPANIRGRTLETHE
jgi:hypothetical protein